MNELLLASDSGTFAPSADGVFANNTLLIHGMANGSAINDNTFLDSSPSSLVITRTGNTAQGTFTPFGNYWGVTFNGTTDYLQTPASVPTLTGDFTIEAWVKPTATGIVIGRWTTGTATQCSFDFVTSSTTKINFSYGIGAANIAIGVTNGNMIVGEWNHIAVTRSGSTFNYFINGVMDSVTGTATGALNACPTGPRIGFNNGDFYGGGISNVRIVNGTALYTGDFTPPTGPLTAVSGTVLLACQSNRFIDNSTNNYAITVVGAPFVTRDNPFGMGPTGINPATNGGSLQNFANTDCLTANTTAATTASTLTGDFTFEVWVYPSFATGQTNWGIFDARNTFTSVPWLINLNTYVAGTGYLLEFYDGTARAFTQRVPINQWSHIAVVRTGSTVRAFINGQLDTATFTSAGTIAGGGIVLNNILDGQHGTAGSGSIGYISNSRLVNGVAEYSTTFTPPTAPLTAVTDTTLLLNASNYGIFDSTGKNNLLTVGNTTISATQSKYGPTSIFFDGTGYIQLPIGPNFYFPGAFTMEMWIYPTSSTFGFELLGINQAGATQWSWAFGNAANTTNGMYWFYGTHGSNETERYTNTFTTLNTWNHVAVCRDVNNVWYFFINGVLQSTLIHSAGLTWSDSVNFTNTTTFPRIGTGFIGYMTDIRVTKDLARYTATFTPPTGSLPNYS